MSARDLALILVATAALFAAACDAGARGDDGASGASRASGAAPTSNAPVSVPAQRIVIAGGALTEIVFALGFGDSVVAVDTSSTYPPEARIKPKVGYQRALAAEGIASQRPSLILLSEEAGPPAAIEQLRGLGVPVHVIPSEASIEGAQEKIRAVAAVLGAKHRGEALAEKLAAEAEEARSLVARARSRPKTAFIYARGGGTLMVGGTGTPADAMIRLAGGENAVTGFEGFKPLSAEALTAAAPEILLLPARSLESLGGEAGLMAQPGVALTPAGTGRRIVALDDGLLLGFGPRTGQAIRELSALLHPELAWR